MAPLRRTDSIASSIFASQLPTNQHSRTTIRRNAVSIDRRNVNTLSSVIRHRPISRASTYLNRGRDRLETGVQIRSRVGGGAAGGSWLQAMTHRGGG